LSGNSPFLNSRKGPLEKRRSVKEGEKLDLDLATYESSHSELQAAIDQTRIKALARGKLVASRFVDGQFISGETEPSPDGYDYYAPSLTSIEEHKHLQESGELITKRTVVGGWVSISEARSMYPSN
jgi:hypothetical protein